MSSSTWLAVRAGLALLLMVGFYALALGVSGLLLFVPWAEVQYAHRLHPKLLVICVASAGMILWSLVPRFDRFEPPGPRLPSSRQPRLFGELGQIARAVGQDLPSEVYLVPEVNAFVSHRGGIMGFGSRRVMGLGLPLLQSLTRSQLRAVLAHEFGHYHGGDVKLGPWIYKTQQAIVRTIQGLGDSLVTKPFELYGKLFFRVSQAVSRHQELQADALAAGVAGAGALAGGLQATHAAALAFAPYWRSEVGPVLEAGFLPPLSSGFARFLSEPRVAEDLSRAVQEELQGGQSDPYDSHPALRERLAALGPAARQPRGGDDPPAVTLLDRLPDLERELLAHMADRQTAHALKPVAWEDVGGRVLAPTWEVFVQKHRAALQGLRAAELGSCDLSDLGRRLARAGGHHDLSAQALAGLADFAIGAGLALALCQAGFEIDAPPGAPVRLRRGELVLEPFAARSTLERLGAQGWRACLEQAGVAEIDLGAAPTRS